MMTADVQHRNCVPSRTALRMPSGIEMRRRANIIQTPSEIETGSFGDQREHGNVAEIALAEIEARIIPDHQEEALQRRLVEAELPFEVPR